ncbi:MAG: TA system VapC family ribonuclease toxin [Chthoniobacteraceae bacterium]
MTPLLDVNVLMTLLWENHGHHGRARQWPRTVTEFATCPVSQLGFARISTHSMLGHRMSPEQSFGVLRKLLSDSRHRFVADDLSCEDRVLLIERIPSANHVTDHYLAALARQHGRRLATFDGALGGAFPDEPGLVEVMP